MDDPCYCNACIGVSSANRIPSLGTTAYLTASEIASVEYAELAALQHDASICHPECGEYRNIGDDGEHAHDNVDGRCWHPDEDMPSRKVRLEDVFRRIETLNESRHKSQEGR